jgi:apolipoprotein N-acyltransferase
MVRSTNMGVTALVDGNGRVLSRQPVDQEGYLRVQIPLDERVGAYVFVGDWLPLLCVSIVIASFAWTALLVALRVRSRLRGRRPA